MLLLRKRHDDKGGLPLIMYAPRGRGGSSLLYISIAYYMQNGGGGGPDSMYKAYGPLLVLRKCHIVKA